MSSFVATKPMPRRPVASTPQEQPAVGFQRFSAVPKLAGVTPASMLEVRPAPEMVSSGIAEIDALTGGLPRGCLTEICGPASSGRTSVLLAALAAATQRQETCALVDTTDAFDPFSAGGANFERLLWIRCGLSRVCHAERSRSLAFRSSRGVEASLSPRSMEGAGNPRFARNDNAEKVEQALRVTDRLLQSGGFGMVAIDLGDVPPATAGRIPLTTWFRFQRAVEKTPTVLFVIGQIPCAQTCAALLLRLQPGKRLSAISSQQSGKNVALPSHAQLFAGLHVEGDLLRSRLGRKPMASITTAFLTKTFWAG
jgi:hypothetical protein